MTSDFPFEGRVYEWHACEEVPTWGGLLIVFLKQDETIAQAHFQNIVKAARGVIYVGLTENLMKRVENHRNVNSGASALRRNLGALLIEELCLKPVPNTGGGAYKFCSKSERRLSRWICENTNFGIIEQRDKKERKKMRHLLIERYSPLLNNEGNPNFSPQLKCLIQKCKESAQQNGLRSNM